METLKPKLKTLDIFVIAILLSAIVGSLAGYFGAQAGSNGSSLAVGGSSSITIEGSEEEAIIAVVEKSAPAVVSIVATQDLAIFESGAMSPFSEFCSDPFFRDFFSEMCRTQPSQAPSETQRRQVGAGSGFIVRSDGLIVTNRHVVDLGKETEFTVITNDGKRMSAKVVAMDPIQDIAILDVDEDNLPVLPLGDSDDLKVGQTVVAIGNALGRFSNTVSKGVVSGLSRSIVASGGSGGSERLDEVIQTDAAINPGNSGGPLLNLAGEVIGVNTAVAQGAQNIGFTIPINIVISDIAQVEETGKITFPFLGVRYALITPELLENEELELLTDHGALIVSGTPSSPGIVPRSPADKAGIIEGDVILRIDGKKITPDNDLADVIQSKKVGDSVTLRILRDGKEMTFNVKLEDRT